MSDNEEQLPKPEKTPMDLELLQLTLMNTATRWSYLGTRWGIAGGVAGWKLTKGVVKNGMDFAKLVKEDPQFRKRKTRNKGVRIALFVLLILWLLNIYKQASSLGRTIPVSRPSLNEDQLQAIVSARVKAEMALILEGNTDNRYENEWNHNDIGHVDNDRENNEDDGDNEDVDIDDDDDMGSNKNSKNNNNIQQVFDSSSTKVRYLPADDVGIIHNPTNAVQSLRSSKRFYVVQSITPSSSSNHKKRSRSNKNSVLLGSNSKGLAETALEQLGYQPTFIITDPNLMWMVASSFECGDSQVTTLLNALSDVSQIVLLCAGGGTSTTNSFISHSNHKNVLDERLRWYSAQLKRHADCPQYSDFMPSTIVISGSKTDSATVERGLVSEGMKSANGYIIKRMIPSIRAQVSSLHHYQFGHSLYSNQLPMVSYQATTDTKRIQKQQHSAGGVVIQRLIERPMLWDARKFSIRTWAVVVRADPLLVIYVPGIIYRSLESFKQPNHGRSRFSKITTDQQMHPEYSTRVDDAYACLNDLQDFISSVFWSAETKHYVDEILVPYLQRLMKFTINALRKEHSRSSSSSTSTLNIKILQRMCFDFVLDNNWNVWLVDASTECGASEGLDVGGHTYTSECKREMVHALGVGSIAVVEELAVKQASMNMPVTGKELTFVNGLELLVDESLTSEIVINGGNGYINSGGRQHGPVNNQMCMRSVYEQFRTRQTFSKRVVQSLLPLDGHPKMEWLTQQQKHLHSQGAPWTCQVCGYQNGGSLPHHCDMCGSGDLHADNEDQDMSSTYGENHAVASRRDSAGLRGMASLPMDEEQHGQSINVRHAEETERYIRFQNERNSAIPNTVSCGRNSEFIMKRNVGMQGEDGHGVVLSSRRAASELSCCVACASRVACVSFTFAASDFVCVLLRRYEVSMRERLGVVYGSRMVEGQSDQERQQQQHYQQQRQQQQQQQQQQISDEDMAASVKNDIWSHQLSSHSDRMKRDRDQRQQEEQRHLLEQQRLAYEQQFSRDSFRADGGEIQHSKEAGYVQYQKYLSNRRENRPRAESGVRKEEEGKVKAKEKDHVDRDMFGLSVSEYRARITQLLSKHDKENVNKVDKLLKKFEGKEMKLLKILMESFHEDQ